jgi:predicted nucleic acid-binding protein
LTERDRHARGLLDTSVVVDLEKIDPDMLPHETLLSAITLAELAAGPHAAKGPQAKANRQKRLQDMETSIAALPFDAATARAFGRVYSEVAASGTKVRGRRTVDLLIAATALSSSLPLYTRNPADFVGLERLIQIIAV